MYQYMCVGVIAVMLEYIHVSSLCHSFIHIRLKNFDKTQSNNDKV